MGVVITKSPGLYQESLSILYIKVQEAPKGPRGPRGPRGGGQPSDHPVVVSQPRLDRLKKPA